MNKRTEARKKNRRKLGKVCAIMAAAGVIGTGTIAGVSAYFTDFNETTNTVTVGNVTTELEEPEWEKVPPEEKEDITPNQTIKKDPQISNTGKNDAYVFLEVTVPVKNVITVDDKGMKKAAADTELFKYTVNQGWIQIQKNDVTEGGKVIGCKYVYAYGTDKVCTRLTPGKVTEALFDSITLVNVIEGQIDDMTLDLPVKSYAIQADHIGESSAPMDVYQVYVNQNK